MTWLMSAIIAAVVVAVLAVSIGLVRRDPVRTIALNAIGYPLFLIGLGVASEVSTQAFWAAAAASLGSLLFTMANRGPRATANRGEDRSSDEMEFIETGIAGR